jgi:hypothetical protein
VTDIDNKARGTAERGVGSSANQGVSAQSRARSQRQTGKLKGNPGIFIGTEQHGDMFYARYEAIRGTWVSASLAERGYDQKYGRDAGFGAYLGIAVDSQLRPLKNPDRIEPGLEYLIPMGPASKPAAIASPASPPPKTAIGSSASPSPKNPLQTKPAPTPWKENRSSRLFKDFTVAIGKLRYPSYELDDDAPPPDREPRAAVAFWLRNHSIEIAEVERASHVSRIAIAGVIAYEALENPQLATIKSEGVGKMHLIAEPGEITWAEAVEAAGKMPKLSQEERFQRFRDSRVATKYIGAALDLIAEDAEKRGWNLRGSPAVLGQIYHSWTPDQWSKHISAKPVNQPFEITPGTMGEWIGINQQYLEKAVGKSQVP